MENIQNIFSSMKYAEVRIDLAKNFPVTIYADSLSGRKARKLFLADIISAEDLPLLINQIEGILAGGQTVLQAHARIKPDVEDSFFLIRCEFKKEKFGRSHLEGFIFDVSGYLEFAGEDRILLEYKRKTKEKIDLINKREIKLLDIIDRDYLKQLQAPFADGGVFSAVYDENENLICSSAEDEKNIPYKKFKHLKRVEIKISRLTAAYWVIASASAELIEINAPLLDVLSQAVTRIANSFVVLYSEMQNSEHANKLLSQHIEQQILISNIYNIIFEHKDAAEALRVMIEKVGDYLDMRRIRIYIDESEENIFNLHYEWKSASCSDSPLSSYSYSSVPKIIEHLEHSDMYIPVNVTEEDGFKPESCTVANLNGDGKRFGIMVFAPAKPGYTPTPQESKVLRSVSQITATLMLRSKADEKLREQAFFDSILGIPNRKKLDEDIKNDLDNGVAGAAAVVKLINLHTFNELFGYKYTDVMLRNAVKFISEMPTSNLSVYRFSGNTLMLLLRKNGEPFKTV